MDTVAKGMTMAGKRSDTLQRPQKGDKFRCDSCGMQIQVTADCRSDEDHPHFSCCGQEMAKL